MPEPNAQPPEMQDLLQAAASGDREAYGRLYRLYLTPVYRYLYSRLRSRVDAEDLAQQVFVKVLRSLDRYQPMGKPLAYFFTVARNTLIDFQKSRREVILPEEIELENLLPRTQRDAPDKRLDQRAQLDRVVRAIDQLTNEHAEVVRLKFFAERSTEEIAQALGKSQEAIRQIQCRALKKLRQLLHENDCPTSN